jgi:predicted DCC family thiol-disulfide oxidoreductase YuxK
MTKGRLDIQPYQLLDLGKLGLELVEAQSAVQLLTDDARYSAARAIAEALIQGRTVWSVAGWLLKTPVILSFAELIYLWVAKNRHRLPGGTPACQMKPS